MTLAALQGRALTRTVDEVRSLIARGEAPSSTLRDLESLKSTGLWIERFPRLSSMIPRPSGGPAGSCACLRRPTPSRPKASERITQRAMSFLPRPVDHDLGY
jgi:hypothetical protein